MPGKLSRSMCRNRCFLLCLPALAMVVGCNESARDPAPSVLVIEAQGVGYSDIGAYGSEIHTPHLDSLASLGLRFTEFYRDLPLPSRIPADSSTCWEGLLPNWSTAEALGPAGHRFYRIGSNPTDGQEPQSSATTQQALAQLDAHARKYPDAPFLLHMIYALPLKGPQVGIPEVARYEGRYTGGWEVLRRERFARMLAIGVVDDRYLLPSSELVETTSGGDAATDATWMERHAGTIERMDLDIGRLLEGLREMDVDRHTLILFLATSGPTDGSAGADDAPHGWRYASSTPYRQPPGSLFEGALKQPLLAYWPDGIARPGHVSRHVSHVRDVAATLLGLTGIRSLEGMALGRQCGSTGRSLEDVFRETSSVSHDTLYWISDGGGAVRLGHWKLVGRLVPPERWMLFDLSTDPTETRDLADGAAERVQHLRTLWYTWAAQYGAWHQPNRVQPFVDSSETP